MADNVTIPASGTGTATPVVATDDVGSAHYQRIKVDGGGDGLSVPIVAGQQLAAASLPVVLASDTGLPAGTNAIGKLAANSGVDIGDVDVTSVPTDPFGANADAASATGSISAKLRGIATALGITAFDLGSGTGGSRTLRWFHDTAQWIGGAGSVTSATQRVTHASDDPVTTSVQLIDDVIYTDDTSTHATGTSKGALIMAAATPTDTSVDANDIGAVAMTTDRQLLARATVASGGIASGAIASGAVASGAVASGAFASGSIASGAIASGAIAAGAIAAGATSIAENEDVGSASGDRGVKMLVIQRATPADTAADLDYSFPQMSAGRLWASATIDAALPAGTNAIGKLASNTGVTIGAVEIAAAQTLATVTTVTTLTGTTTLTPGTGATNLGKAEDGGHTTGDVGVMALGVYNATLTAISGTDLDYTPFATEKTGRVVTAPFAPVDATITGTASVTDTTSTSVIAAGAGSLRNYITSVQVANSGATAVLVTLQDGSGGTALARTYAPAGGGSNIYFPVPLKTTAATALYFAAGGSTTTLYVSAQGYRAL